MAADETLAGAERAPGGGDFNDVTYEFESQRRDGAKGDDPRFGMRDWF
jgi:hypothetical protein